MKKFSGCSPIQARRLGKLPSRMPVGSRTNRLRRLALSMILCVNSSWLFAAEPVDTQLTSRTHGFSITVPVDKAPKAQVYQLAIFYLPTTDGPPPSINIQRQRYTDSMLEYDKLSKSQFEHLKVEIIAAEFKKGVLMYEYVRKAPDKPAPPPPGTTERSGQGSAPPSMHWYSKAYKQGEFVYLVTAASLETQWESRKKQLIESVNSFKFAIPGEDS